MKDHWQLKKLEMLQKKLKLIINLFLKKHKNYQKWKILILKLKYLTFQCEIIYKRKNREKYIRIISNIKEEVENKVN